MFFKKRERGKKDLVILRSYCRIYFMKMKYYLLGGGYLKGYKMVVVKVIFF